MGEAKEIRISEYEHLHNHPSIQINGYPRDLLQRFRAGNHFTAELSTTTTTKMKKKKSEEEEEEELNLGLSLGSLFGMKGPSEKRLVRSSSIAGLTTALFRGEEEEEEEEVSLIRTCSLPVEPEEDLRKRKEMQSLRRLEAKRKRSEKQRNCRVKEKEKPSSLDEDDKRAVVLLPGGGGEEQGLIVNKGFKQQQQQYMVSDGFSFRPPNWASPSSQVQRSQGSSSSGTSEIEGRPAHHQGSSSCTESRSPRSVQSLPELSEQKSVVAPTTTTPPNAEKPSMSTGVEVENPSNKPKVNDNGSREMGMKMMEEENMPCCWTTGSGPNGKRIEGLLYNYRKGEEVRIVCVCHGSFLTPAEFVKHAGGGGDVENPLRHITVNLSSSSSF